MDAGAAAGLTVFLVVLALLLKAAIVVVHQAEVVVVERLGRFKEVLGSGIHLIVPLIDRPRPFTWSSTYIDVGGQLRTTQTSHTRIDLRESVFNFPRQMVYSRDTVSLSINALIYYRIVNARKAVYEVDDLQTAIAQVAQTQIKEVFGAMTFSEALQSQDQINEHMRRAFGERFARWGVLVERLELLDLTPKAGTQISASMRKQMIAERERRADFIRAEGEKTATRLRADGYAREKQNIGVAEQEALRKRSEGTAGAKVTLAEAESRSLDMLHAAVAADGAQQTEFLLSRAFIGFVKGMGSRVARKTIYLPYELGGLQGIVGGLRGAFGRGGSSAAGVSGGGRGGGGAGGAGGPGRAQAAAAMRPEYDDLS